MEDATVEVPTVDPDITLHVSAAGARKARETAGEGTVAVTAGGVARPCLELGLPDAYVGEPSSGDVHLGDRTVRVQGDRVAHLLLPVARESSRP